MSRSSSARRHRHTVNSVADRELHGYLELFGEPGAPTDFSRFNSLPRSGRTHQRRTTPWILSDLDSSPELGRDRQHTALTPSPETEPISPLARFSSPGFNANEDPYCNNNNYRSVSEGSALPSSCYIFRSPAQLPNPTITGHMNISVEKHMLVQGPQTFDLASPNNNSNHTHFVQQRDFGTYEEGQRGASPINLVLDITPLSNILESDADPKELGKAGITQSGDWLHKDREEEDNSNLSSTTCDTPLPLDSSVYNKKPMFNILDCTEADCSVALDYSEIDSLPILREGLDLKTPNRKNVQEMRQNTISPNEKSASTSTNELSTRKSTDASSITPSATTEDWDTDSCDTAEGKKAGKILSVTSAVKLPHAKSKVTKAVKGLGCLGVRTLTNSENQGMRKVVPLTRHTRSVSSKRAERPSVQESSSEPRRPLRDQSTPARGRSEKTIRTPRHSSLPPDEAKAQRGSSLASTLSRWAWDNTPKKSSFHKPSAKPLRNIPKAPPEEKMCRSTMRALAQAQAEALAQAPVGASSEASSSQTLGPKTNSGVPRFARNTVASTSRKIKELVPASVPSTPSRSPSLLARTGSAIPTRMPSPVQNTTISRQAAPPGEEPTQGATVRRVQSVRAVSRSAYRSGTPPPPTLREEVCKANSFSDKSTQSREVVSTTRGSKPTWK